MQPYATKALQEFAQQIETFKHLWRSVLVRTTWARLEEKDRILALSVTLEQKEPKDLPKPPHCPDVRDLHSSWEAFDIAQLGRILEDLSSGIVNVEGKQLYLEIHRSNKWSEWGSLHFAFNHPGEYAYGDTGSATIGVGGFESANDAPYESVKDSVLTPHLKSLKAPFENIQDVLENFLGLPRGHRDQNQILVSIRADTPIILGSDTNVHAGRLKTTVTMPETADPAKVSIGLIESSHDRVVRRSTLPIAAETWCKDSGLWKMSHESPLREDVTKALVVLRYAGVFLAQRSMLALHSGKANAALRVHSLLDPDNEELLKCLAGQGKRRDEYFEQAVSWLFGFCGFVTQLYGHFTPVEEDGVDVLAYSPEARILLCVECAISHPQTLGKVPKLVTRCRRMGEVVKDADVKVIPVLATALEEVSESERKTANQDEIALVTQKELLYILQMAGTGKQSVEVAEHIRSLIETKSSGPLGGWFGGR